ncbi:MAG: DUF3500 domain-containing protein [Cyclobacteriaceae bacterium]|nr:DUF3500 domain-containing protein [Cyclobacteriaceae bacterium]
MKNSRNTLIWWVLPAILVLFLFGKTAAPDAKIFVKSASNLLSSLTSAQKEKISKPLTDSNRYTWTYLPPYSVPRQGLPLKEMDEKQQNLTLAMLKLCLSETGYDKTRQIMGLEEVLRILEKNEKRDTEMYFVTFFGTPDNKKPWSWRFEGHHISLHFSFADGKMRFTPQFLGSNPAEVREGPMKGLRVLKNEQDIALKLLHSLDNTQRNKAIFSLEAFKDIVTTNAEEVKPLDAVGIPASELTAQQKEILWDLIDEYIDIMPGDVAALRKEKLEKAGKDNILFGWAGEDEYTKPHYYRVQGPTFLIEFDNTQNNANHIHSVWRDYNGDFGRDIIKEHYGNSDHHE